MSSSVALMVFNLDLLTAHPDTCQCLRRGLEPQARVEGGQAEVSLSQALDHWESFGSVLSINCLWQGSWQGKALRKQKARRSPSQVRREGEQRSHVAQPVPFQQNLIKTSNTVGRRFRTDVSVAQWRLSAVKLYRALGGERDAGYPGSRRSQGLKVPRGACAGNAGSKLWHGTHNVFSLLLL